MVGIEVEVEQVLEERSLAVGELAGEEDERAPSTAASIGRDAEGGTSARGGGLARRPVSTTALSRRHPLLRPQPFGARGRGERGGWEEAAAVAESGGRAWRAAASMAAVDEGTNGNASIERARLADAEGRNEAW